MQYQVEDNMNYDSIVPLYVQIAALLKKDIESGSFKQTGRIPTEGALADQYQVSRITVRKAVEELVNQGLVEKKQGKGTFITSQRFSRHLDTGPVGFTEMCQSIGLVPSAKILKTEICVPKPSEVRKKLQLKEDEPAIHISRLRCGDDRPIAMEESYYPMKYSDLLSLDLEKDSIYAYLRDKKGIELRSTTIRLRIVRADAKLSKLLCVPRNAAQLEIRGFVVQSNGEPVHTSYQVGYGEDFEFILR